MRYTVILFSVLFHTIVGGCVDPDDDPPPFTIPPQIYPSPYSDPYVSQDGSNIIFIRAKLIELDRSGYNPKFDLDSIGLWMCEIDGSNMRIIYKADNNSISNPQFTPDQAELVFGENGNIYKARISDSLITENDLIPLTIEGRNFFPSMSPDGKWISYDSNFDTDNGMYFIWKMRSDGSQKSRITYTPTKGENRSPFWTSDNRILHLRYSTAFQSTEIYSMDTTGQNVVRLSFNDTYDLHPKSSPRSGEIVFSSTDSGRLRQLFMLNNSTGEATQLTTAGITSSFSWTNDGRIVYVQYSPTNYSKSNGTIWIMNSDGSNKKQLTRNEDLVLE